MGKADQTIEASQATTVAEAWNAANPDQPMPQDILMAVNQVYATPQFAVNAGDEIAFFPPVTGG